MIFISLVDGLPDCSSLTVLVIVEPVKAANVAEWEARKRDIRLKRSSFKHFEDSPSLRVRITLSCKMSATHNPVCVCTSDRRERKHQRWSHRPSEYSRNYSNGRAKYSQTSERHPWRQNGLSASSHWDWQETRPSTGRFHLSRGAAWSCCCPQGSDGLAWAQSGTPENGKENISHGYGYACHYKYIFEEPVGF